MKMLYVPVEDDLEKCSLGVKTFFRVPCSLIFELCDRMLIGWLAKREEI